ncbi:MAG: MurR/RpiR family transcriptional regulator [Erysipelotrichaceae bacterium]|nr:MurR/RpiR family transcriptional regulator [Erysipelotrichaceae bacterium]
MNIIEALEKKEKFSNSEEALADYILANKDDVINMSIQELAAEAFVSTSCIIRLCKKLEMDGFPEFKLTLATQLSNKSEEIAVDPNFPFLENDSFYEVARKVHTLTMSAIDDTYSKFSARNFDKAVRMIKRAQKVSIFARGDNYMRALSFCNMMMKIGYVININTIPMEDDHVALGLHENDLAIIISYSGSTFDIIRTCKILERNNVPLISITAKPKSKVAEQADLLFLISDKESQSIKFSNFASQEAIAFVLNTIYSLIFVSDYDRNSNRRIEDEKILINGRNPKSKGNL